ncbi:hypothetical protein [uncultured Mediterranean phage]|nr:hypothetical protein [uncultured Mediterranean phage]
MKLIIVIEGDEADITAIASHLSDGGGEEMLHPAAFRDSKEITFSYAECFPAWGYDRQKHGWDRVVRAIVHDSVPS